MKKETLTAIIFGIFLGGVVAFFIINKTKEIELNKNKVIAPKNNLNNNKNIPDNTQAQPLEITSPQDGLIVSQNSTSIAGKVEKDTLLVIQSPIKDMTFLTIKSDFKISFPLALGANVIKIVAYPKNKTFRPQEKDLKIYYIDSEL